MARVAPEQFWPFSLAVRTAACCTQNACSCSIQVWAHHKEYHDLPASDMTPRQVRQKIADLAVQFIGEGKRQSFLDLLTNSESAPNYGVAVTNDLKYTGEPGARPLSSVKPLIFTTVKFSRQNGIHVSPTVLFDGIVAPEVSSSWGEKEWLEWLDKKVQ